MVGHSQLESEVLNAAHSGGTPSRDDGSPAPASDPKHVPISPPEGSEPDSDEDNSPIERRKAAVPQTRQKRRRSSSCQAAKVC